MQDQPPAPPAPADGPTEDSLAHRIHDEVLQPLTVASMRLQLLRRQFPEPRLDSGRDLIVQAIDHLREIGAATAAPAGAAAVPSTPPLDVVVLDDVAENRLLVASVLRSAGMSVRTVARGEEMLDLIDSQQRPDLCLIDLSLNGESGGTVAAQLRARAELEHTILVALSAIAPEEVEGSDMLRSFDAHLTKPIDIPTFADTVRDIAQRRRSRA